MRVLFLLLIPVLLVAVVLLVRQLMSGRRTGSSPVANRSDRILFEDALKHLYKCEVDRTRATVQSLAGQLRVSDDRATEILTDFRDR